MTLWRRGRSTFISSLTLGLVVMSLIGCTIPYEDAARVVRNRPWDLCPAHNIPPSLDSHKDSGVPVISSSHRHYRLSGTTIAVSSSTATGLGPEPPRRPPARPAFPPPPNTPAS